MNYLSQQPKKVRRGFTLVETLVAITILTLSILAPFDAIERVINTSRLAKDQLIASSLAQETLEYVRFFRTSNYLSNANSLMDGMNNSGGRFNTAGAVNCRINLCAIDAVKTVGAILSSCNSTSLSSCPLLYTTNAGVYTIVSTSNPTIFKRGFSYTQFSNYERVTVQIQWDDHGSHTFMLTENLYDWF